MRAGAFVLPELFERRRAPFHTLGRNSNGQPARARGLFTNSADTPRAGWQNAKPTRRRALFAKTGDPRREPSDTRPAPTARQKSRTHASFRDSFQRLLTSRRPRAKLACALPFRGA
jgi:hypothetical protein